MCCWSEDLSGVFLWKFSIIITAEKFETIKQKEADEQEKANCLNEFLVRWEEVGVRTQMDFLRQEEKPFPESLGSQCGGM